jgi:uncharacterized membrane protein YbhN (UPF0104 family)
MAGDAAKRLYRRVRERWARLSPRGRTVVAIVLAALLALGAGAAIGRVAEYGEVVEAIESADPTWLPVCLVGEVIAYLGYTLAFREAARVAGGPPLTLGLTARVVFVAFGAFAAANAAGGLATDIWALHEAGVGARESVRRVLGLNTLLYAVFGGAAWIAALVALATGGPTPRSVSLPWLALGSVCFGAAAWFAAGGRAARVASRRTGGVIARAFADVVGGLVLFGKLIRHPCRHAAGLVGALLYWGGDLACLWGALRAFEIELPLAALVLVYATGYVANLLPLPGGGAGAVDASIAFALTLVGVDLAPALLATFTYRFFTYWLPILPALVAIPTVPDLRSRLRALAAQQASA